MPKQQFQGALLKLNRAIKHIHELRAEFGVFVDGNSYTFEVANNPKKDGIFFVIKLQSPLSSNFAIILGDAAHNLRAALDHLVWEAVGSTDNAQYNKIAFPCAKNSEGVESLLGRIQTTKPGLKDLLRGFEPYPGGDGESLYHLHQLDIIDKHRIIVPATGAGGITGLQIVRGEELVASFDNCTISIKPDGRLMIPIAVSPDCLIKFKEKPEVAINIRFDDEEVFPFEPVIPTLVKLAQKIANIRELFIEISRGWK